MGYMGLDHWNDSDNSSELVCEITDAIGKKLLERVELKDNHYNTDGCVDVALFCESFWPDTHTKVHKDTDLYNAIVKAAELIKEKIKNSEDIDETLWDDKEYHVLSYKRMLNNLNELISKAV
jgi:hypothetical protein